MTVQRLASAVSRRLRYAQSRLTTAGRHPPAEAALQWLVEHDDAAGMAPAAHGNSRHQTASGDAAASGGVIETLIAVGAIDVAVRWARRLETLQKADGSFGETPSHTSRLFDAALAARGLLAIEPHLPEARSAAMAACQYLHCGIEENRPGIASGQTTPEPAAVARVIARVALPPLLEGVRRFARPDWIPTAQRVIRDSQGASRSVPWDAPLQWLAWSIDSLIELGEREAAAKAMDRFDLRQRRNGSLVSPAGAGPVSASCAAHLAVCWYKLALRDPSNRERADRAMRWLAGTMHRTLRPGRRGTSSTFCQGPMATIWLAKHYLDAALLQVQAAFDHQTGEFPDQIDPHDGRVDAEDARLVDVGCGKGRFLRHLAAWLPAARLTGVDVSAAMLACLPPGVTATQGNMLHIPSATGAFDGALAVESLEHALLPRRAVDELCRVVRPGGRVLIIDKHRRRQPLSLHDPWERWCTPEELAAWLGSHCDQVETTPLRHREGRPGAGLFLAVEGRRRPDRR
jgi:SAM-dependent methyltransferase